MSQELNDPIKEKLASFSILKFKMKTCSQTTVVGLLGRELVKYIHPFELTRSNGNWDFFIKSTSIKDSNLEFNNLTLEEVSELIYSFKKNFNSREQDMRELLIMQLKRLIR